MGGWALRGGGGGGVAHILGIPCYDLDPIPQLIVEVVLEEAPYQFIPGHWLRAGKIRSGA